MEEKKQKGKIWYYIIGVFIVVFIAMVILPAFQKHGHPPRIYCQSNCHTLSICFQIYHMNEGPWPAKANWCDLIKSYADEETEHVKKTLNRKIRLYQCPKDKTGPCSYAMNENIPDDANELPDDLVLLFESAPGWNQIGGPDDVITDRHKRPGASITFADGHVEFVKPEDIPNLRWTVEE